jgi:hypothetical protein
VKHADVVFNAAVKALGEQTTEQLVALMRKAGIKGRPSTAYSCPMANFLGVQCGVSSKVVGVGKKFIIRRYLRAGKTREERVKTPASVTRFLVNFDIGKYPDLFAPPPRAVKAKKVATNRAPDKRKKPPGNKVTKVKRDLVALLGGRGFRAGT